MVTDEIMKRAVEAYAKDTGAEDWQLEGWIEPAIRAALKAALSAAEPQPVPSVAVKVKPLEWKEGNPGSYTEIAESPFGHYSVWEINGTGCWAPWKQGSGSIVDGGLAGAKAAAQADYEARILSALSAQVQDVAALESQVTHEDICNTHEGGPCNCDWSATDEYQAHPDDIAVDRFAAVMKVKLAKKRDEGRSGWEDKDECSQIFLSQLLREHVEKGDPVDVGNLAMMLHQRGERIASLLETLQGE